MATETTTRTIAPPRDFPVSWERPEDEARLWERELMHVPKQATVLDDELMRRWIDQGFNGALAAYDMPVRNAFRRINTYEYQSIMPITHDPDVLEQLGRSAQERVGAVLPRQLELWEREWLPEIKRFLTDWDGFDLAGASDAELLAHLDETVARSERAWEIHFLTVFPAVLSMSLFDDAYRELLGSADALEPYRLLQGQPNHSTEADRALFELGRKMAASPVVRGVLEREPVDAVFGKLEASEEGRAFLPELDGYLGEYGKRQDGYISISEPSWVEEPGVVLAALRDYVTQPDRNPEAELAKLAEKRERLTAEVRARVAELGPEAGGRFEFLLDAARQGSVLQENHNFWIDGHVVCRVRWVVLETGRRLAAAGVIPEPGDVFHLTLEELRSGLEGASGNLSARVAERRAELERFSSVEAPPVLGTLPPGPPPDDPFARAIFRMFGPPPAPQVEETVIRGMAGSPGMVRGRARVVHSLADAGRLERGEILVTGTTSPPWTSLFQVAAAVVTDVGGVLSHCAVVAREYMIPAVVGTRTATTLIRDGRLIEVDGDEGVVRLLEDE